MPLNKSKTRKAFGQNVAAEMAAGKPQKQSLAIAYNVAGKPAATKPKAKSKGKSIVKPKSKSATK